MKFCKTDLVFCTKLDYFSNCCHSASVAVLQLKFSSWPKMLFESTWLSTIFAVLLWLVYSKKCNHPVLCSGSCWWHIAEVSCVWDIIFNVLHLPYLVKSYCFVYKQNMYAHKRKDVQTHTGTRVFLSSSCLERMPPNPIPRGSCFEWKAFMANAVWIQNTFLAGWARACEKQIVSIQISLFSISFSAWERTIGMSPGRTQFGYWPFFNYFYFFININGSTGFCTYRQLTLNLQKSECQMKIWS